MADANSMELTYAQSQFSVCGSEFRGYFNQSEEVLRRLPFAEMEEAAARLYRAYEDGRKVLLFGNGGSASLASHFACDLGKGTVIEAKLGKRFQVLSLADNMA